MGNVVPFRRDGIWQQCLTIDIWNDAERFYMHQFEFSTAIGKPLTGLTRPSVDLVGRMQNYKNPSIGFSDFDLRAALIRAFNCNYSNATHVCLIENANGSGEKLIFLPKPSAGYSYVRVAHM